VQGAGAVIKFRKFRSAAKPCCSVVGPRLQVGCQARGQPLVPRAGFERGCIGMRPPHRNSRSLRALGSGPAPPSSFVGNGALRKSSPLPEAGRAAETQSPERGTCKGLALSLSFASFAGFVTGRSCSSAGPRLGGLPGQPLVPRAGFKRRLQLVLGLVWHCTWFIAQPPNPTR
jgi:hypothetical protein